MSFDGFFLHHMTAELREQVLYGRIQKVNQPFERELVLTIRNNRQNYKLLLSAHPVFGRIQTTKADLPNPQNPNTYTFRDRLSRISSNWKTTVSLRFPSLIKMKSVIALRLLLLWKSWGNTPTLS